MTQGGQHEVQQKPLNLAARAGRWSATHWKTATAIWIVVVAVAIVAGSMAGTRKLSMAEQSTGEPDAPAVPAS
ncbi:MAG TPA: hypothetical protein VLD16_10605 [Gaiellaceae bacterium]|nr:hypothetical protein [Gaiellaceae bacterium]